MQHRAPKTKQSHHSTRLMCSTSYWYLERLLGDPRFLLQPAVLQSSDPARLGERPELLQQGEQAAAEVGHTQRVLRVETQRKNLPGRIALHHRIAATKCVRVCVGGAFDAAARQS